MVQACFHHLVLCQPIGQSYIPGDSLGAEAPRLASLWHAKPLGSCPRKEESTSGVTCISQVQCGSASEEARAGQADEAGLLGTAPASLQPFSSIL